MLAVKAGVHLWVRNFAIINSVGAVSINAQLDCDSFASAHRDTSHYDRASFVGLAYRPKNEKICCGECGCHSVPSRHSFTRDAFVRVRAQRCTPLAAPTCPAP